VISNSSEEAVVIHPKARRDGTPVEICSPTRPTPSAHWANPLAAAIFVPQGECPTELNCIRVAAVPAPFRAEELALLAGDDRNDPLWPTDPPLSSLTRKAGAIVIEPDGRVWLFEPTNHYSGTLVSVPKGTIENDATARTTAVKEVHEETGLLVQLERHVGDVVRGDALVRLYRAHRIGGSPCEMGWESQSVMLVPVGLLDVIMWGRKEADFVDAIRVACA
jgi:8-oxo-dGTP pyrophosphatase MutT (NUDIX family)